MTKFELMIKNYIFITSSDSIPLISVCFIWLHAGILDYFKSLRLRPTCKNTAQLSKRKK